MAIRVLLADDHDLVRAGMRNLVESLPQGCQIVGEAADGQMAVKLAEQLAPDMVLMDLSMPLMNGIEATRHIVREGSGGLRAGGVRVIMLSMHWDRQKIVEAFRAGVGAYLLKSSGVDELGMAFTRVLAGHTYLSRGVTDVVVETYLRGRTPVEIDSVYRELSMREREVLQLVAEGKTTKQIASGLHISPKTVEVHRGQVMSKLSLHTVAELTKYAIREGLTSLEV